jgi:hypothetical protein
MVSIKNLDNCFSKIKEIIDKPEKICDPLTFSMYISKFINFFITKTPINSKKVTYLEIKQKITN